MAKLGEMLIKEGLATAEQVEAGLKIAKRDGGPLGRLLIRQGVLTEKQLADVLARQTGLPKFDQDPKTVETSLTEKFPATLASKFMCAPLMRTGDVLHVGFLAPDDGQAADELGRLLGKTIKALILSPATARQVWMRLYGRADFLEDPIESESASSVKTNARTRKTKARIDLSAEEAAGEVKAAAGDIPAETKTAEEQLPELSVDPDDAPVVRIVNGLLMEALQCRASDVHLEPFPEFLRVRFRVDGEMRIAHELPASCQAALVSRLKIMASLDIAERRFPQDGRIKLALPGRGSIDFRVSTLPGIHGEKTVIRVLGAGKLSASTEQLGFQGKALQYVREALRNPYGMILVTGPTGSGKTTTLYTMLRELSRPNVNVVTAEDPVEYNLPDITQVSVKPQIGFTFDVALRSFLRQDPDIILVGEMRDFETAAIAVKAALTGHLVFSTVHTNDAPSTVVRLVDMGIEPYLVASAVKLVIAQRLVRKICENCRQSVEISPEEQDTLHESTLAGLENAYRGLGCDKCGRTGFFGRLPVFEVMPIKSKELKRVITEGGTEVMVSQVARREGLRTLKDEGLRLVNEGVTSLEEAMQLIAGE